MKTPDHIPDAVQSYVNDITAEGITTVELLRRDVSDGYEAVGVTTIPLDDHQMIQIADLTLADALQVREQCNRAAMELIEAVKVGDPTKQVDGHEGYLADHDVDDDVFLAGLNIARANLMGEMIQRAIGRIDRSA